MTKTYDFIVVGGGTSGIITASKLVQKVASIGLRFTAFLYG